MKITGKYCNSIATESERLDKEMEDEIFEQNQNLKKYSSNINSLLGKSRSKEVFKSMINYLVEQL